MPPTNTANRGSRHEQVESLAVLQGSEGESSHEIAFGFQPARKIKSRTTFINCFDRSSDNKSALSTARLNLTGPHDMMVVVELKHKVRRQLTRASISDVALEHQRLCLSKHRTACRQTMEAWQDVRETKPLFSGVHGSIAKPTERSTLSTIFWIAPTSPSYSSVSLCSLEIAV